MISAVVCDRIAQRVGQVQSDLEARHKGNRLLSRKKPRAYYLAYLVSDEVLACTGAQLHAVATFIRTGSNPVSWKVASWRTFSLSETASFNVAPSGTDCKSLLGLCL